MTLVAPLDRSECLHYAAGVTGGSVRAMTPVCFSPKINIRINFP